MFCGFGWQQFAQVREDVGEVDAVAAALAQVDDAVDFHLAEIIGKLASFQRLEQAADHGSFSHPAAPDDGHQALGVIVQELRNFHGFEIAILEIIRCNPRRGIDEFGAGFRRNRFFRLAFAFQSSLDVLLGLFFGGFWIINDLLLRLNLCFQFFDFGLDAFLFITFGAAQIAFGVSQRRSLSA